MNSARCGKMSNDTKKFGEHWFHIPITYLACLEHSMSGCSSTFNFDLDFFDDELGSQQGRFL